MFLIDGYNCVYAGAAMGGAFGGLTVRGLCQWIMVQPKAMKAVVVLDGRAKPDEPGANEFPEVTIVYSGTGVKADTVIGQKVERSGKRSKITVVSNDGEVVLHARREHAKVMSCEAFLAMLAGTREAEESARRARAANPKRTGTQTSGETEHWMKEFGITPPGPEAAKPRAMEDEFPDIDMDKLMGG